MNTDRKRRLSTWFTTRVVNPLVRWQLEHGIAPKSVALLETTGRKSGQPRRNPVGKLIEDDTLWIVSEHGRRAAYVRNLEANPRVRVKVGRRWRNGSARVLPDDDWRERQRRLPNKLNSAMVRVMSSDPVTVRVDLEP